MTPTLAIVGGGISGTLTVLNLIKQCRSSLNVIWFDANNQFCKGAAYSTLDDKHLLNVRANNMSVFVDEPLHFVEWLTKNYSHYTATDFIPRRLYGDYVQNTFDSLKNTNPLITIIQIAEEVIDINRIDKAFELKATQNYVAHKLVLSFGNFLPAHPRSVTKKFIKSECYFQNAFHPNIYRQTASKKNITIIGSGLTMIDVIVSLYNHSYKGAINIISPHAYIPQAHHQNPLPSIKPFIDATKTYNLKELFSLVNKQLKKAKNEALNPHSVIDMMRPYLQSIWLNFTLTDKQQFLRHLRHKWGVARHRVPKESIAIFEQLQSLGVITLLKGKISDIKTIGSNFEIHYSNSSNNYSFKTELIINCTGPESNYFKIPSVLIKNLIKNGFFTPDCINYGINSDKNGEISTNIYTLGPPLKGILWESTAVPEIRLQAKDLASKIICN